MSKRTVRKKRGDDEPPMSGPPVTHIKNLVADPDNPRRHNPRNIGVIEDALRTVGAARSIVIDEDNRVLAGNGTVEAAAQAGITAVRVIDATGHELIAVRRVGLSPADKRRLSLFDNQAAALSEWDVVKLAEISAEGAADRVDLTEMFSTREIADLLAAVKLQERKSTAPAEFQAITGDLQTDHQCPRCGYEWSGPCKKPEASTAKEPEATGRGPAKKKPAKSPRKRR